ncbi:hypothetical protein EV361DRAFT_955785 [Lentinula raphanica]|nr:hypothetical protein EV361DRAFT_955785 [Lentinula raphanica]
MVFDGLSPPGSKERVMDSRESTNWVKMIMQAAKQRMSDKQKGWYIVLSFFKRDDMNLAAAEKALHDLYGTSYEPTLWCKVLQDIENLEDDHAGWWDIHAHIQKKLRTYVAEIDDRRPPDWPRAQSADVGTGEDEATEEAEKVNFELYRQTKSFNPTAARHIKEMLHGELIRTAEEVARKDGINNPHNPITLLKTRNKAAWNKMCCVAHSRWQKICDEATAILTSKGLHESRTGMTGTRGAGTGQGKHLTRTNWNLTREKTYLSGR